MNVFLQNNKKHVLLEILLSLVLITIPLKHIINSVVVFLFFLVSIYFALIYKMKNNSKIIFLLILFYILGASSLLWTNNLSNTILGLSRFLSYLIIPLSFIFVSKIEFRKHIVLDAFYKSIFIYAIYCILIACFNSCVYNDISYMFYHKLSNNLFDLNAIYFSVFVSFSIFVILNKKNKNKLDILIFIFLLFFLILLSSKSILFFSFIFLVIKYYSSLKKKIIKNKLISLSIFFMFLLISFNIMKRIKTEVKQSRVHEILEKKDFGPVYIWTGFGLRMFQIKMFYEIFLEKENHFLGQGLNNSQTSLNNKYKEYNLYSGFFNYNYHNQYIQVIAELGFLGLIILSLIFYMLWKQFLLNRDYNLLVFFLLILMICFTESFLWRQRGMVFFVTVLIILTDKKMKAVE